MLTCREVRQILIEFTGGRTFDKSYEETKKMIRRGFFCSEYTVKTLAREFCREDDYEQEENDTDR